MSILARDFQAYQDALDRYQRQVNTYNRGVNTYNESFYLNDKGEPVGVVFRAGKGQGYLPTQGYPGAGKDLVTPEGYALWANPAAPDQWILRKPSQYETQTLSTFSQPIKGGSRLTVSGIPAINRDTLNTYSERRELHVRGLQSSGDTNLQDGYTARRPIYATLPEEMPSELRYRPPDPTSAQLRKMNEASLAESETGLAGGLLGDVIRSSGPKLGSASRIARAQNRNLAEPPDSTTP